MNAEMGEVKDKIEPEEANASEQIDVAEEVDQFSVEGEVVPEFIDEASVETGDVHEVVEGVSELEELRIALREAEEKNLEAERKVQDFTDRFRSAQNTLKVEAEEQRKRMQKSFDQRLEAGRADIIANLLETLDNLKRAIAVADHGVNKEKDFDALLSGVKATATLFESKMQSLGLSPVPSVGEQFNPEIHEAVEIVEVTPEHDNIVVDEFKTGYKFGDKLLRPAIVRVGRSSM